MVEVEGSFAKLTVDRFFASTQINDTDTTIHHDVLRPRCQLFGVFCLCFRAFRRGMDQDGRCQGHGEFRVCLDGVGFVVMLLCGLSAYVRLLLLLVGVVHGRW